MLGWIGPDLPRACPLPPVPPPPDQQIQLVMRHPYEAGTPTSLRTSSTVIIRPSQPVGDAVQQVIDHAIEIHVGQCDACQCHPPEDCPKREQLDFATPVCSIPWRWSMLRI